MKRRLALMIPAIALVDALTLSGCTTTRADGSPKIETTQEADREGLQGVAKAPLRDLNVLRTKIPEVLLQALADPYERPRTLSCPELITLMKPLNDALGADLDVPSVDQDDLLDKGRNTALGVMAGAASDVIPFRGWVRKLTGAERHDHLVQASIVAGAVRRGYLKGLGEAKGCSAPARPSHVLAGSPVIDQSGKPKYPIR